MNENHPFFPFKEEKKRVILILGKTRGSSPSPSTSPSSTYRTLVILELELLLLDSLQLIPEVELSGLLLQLGEFVLVLGHLLQGRFDALDGRGKTERDGKCANGEDKFIKRGEGGRAMAVGLCVFFSLFSDFFSFRFSLSFEEGCGGSEGEEA